MTGYGMGEAKDGDIYYQVEIKSLNSKSTDIRCKLPDGFMQEEILIRQAVKDKVLRGRIEVLVTDLSQGDSLATNIDENAIVIYYNKLKGIAQSLGEPTDQILPSLMRNQDVMKGANTQLSKEQWTVVEKATHNAIIDLNNFRKDEGKVLADELLQRASNIAKLLPSVEKYELIRIEKLKERLQKNLVEFIQKDKIDQNRFEQEVLFYIEKLDITEEKIRLAQHCKYFEEQVNTNEPQKGKVLTFIAQEMGREINTLGAKAQDSDLQKVVVKMKDELEKIKEQLANIL
jgi:uncharacterized protein (TIGR00255 family)